ncbi:hypothetical protein L9F63_011446 [Diploptera punctata]|uniref:Uncharacterized protein n=1 Tax=Diploptera punctata TaxID=6984 RepID=A0AAD8AG71_DIPPU|nr:hypothetical protein L9F63_011446 [Diploptera punctata]
MSSLVLVQLPTMEGLFVKHFLSRTVSTTPRARPAQATEQATTMERTSEGSTLHQVRTSGGEDWSDGGRSPLSPGPGLMYSSTNRTKEKEHSEKKKKWSLGGLFRRRKKEIGSESSSQDEEEETPRKGFLARRRSRREKRKPRTNKSAVTFDHIVVNPLAQTLKPHARSERVEEVNGCARDANGNNVMRSKDLPHVEDASRRELQSGGSVDRLSSKSSRDSYQRHARQDSSLSRNSSGGSGSLEQGTGTRRGRRAVKARAEALRDRQRAESSSEEGEVTAGSSLSRFKSDDTLSVSLQRDSSLNRRSRLARTERYIKRLSRDEECILKREAAELEFQRQQRLCKSDAEGSFNKSISRNKIIPGTNRWTGVGVYHESSDLEHPKMYIRGSSATPSPGHSPLVRHKNIVHYTNSAPASGTVGFDGTTSTFPPSHAIHYATPVTTNSLDRKTPQHNVRPRGPSPLLVSNRSAESIPNVGIPRARINDYRHAKQNYDYITSVRNERDYIEFQQPGQRSLSFDSNIHRVMPNYSSGTSPIPDANDVMVVQFPVARLPPAFQQSRSANITSGFVAIKQIPPPPPPPRDPQRRLLGQSQDSIRPMSFASDNGQQRYLHKDVHISSDGVTPFAIPPLGHHPSAELPISDVSWAPNNQRRSNSDNQLATHRFGPHPHAFNPLSRPRPSSGTPESMKPLTHPYGGHGTKFVIRTTPSSDTYISPPNHTGQQQQFQYFADQQPRSRRPIHIQYNASTTSNNDQPYLSDSQVLLVKPPHHQEKRNPMQHATEFWRQKDQEGTHKQKKAIPTSPRLQMRQINRTERSRSNSPRPRELPTGLAQSSDSTSRLSKSSKVRVSPLSIPSVKQADSLSSLSGNSDISSPMQMNTCKFSPDIPIIDNLDSGGNDSLRKKENQSAHRPLSMVLENSEGTEHSQTPEKVKESPVESVPQKEQPAQSVAKIAPPTPPSRRYSRQSSTSSLEAADWMSEDAPTSEDGKKKKRKSSNLEDALTELEAIYKSLRLGDEDLLDRAERRDLPTPHQKLSDSSPSEKRYPISSSLSTSRGAESDSGYNYSWGSSSFESLFDGGEPPPRRRAPSLRRSGIPDKVMDDMAYRRLHPKERPGSQDIRNVMSQTGSYLESSPVSAATDGTFEDSPQKPLYGPLNQEPDITLDDVVYRNIRHANNTLKVLDPQPPFGIPIGPIAPAPNSDYLHAVPGDVYRSMFKPRKTPDVVKDDLAYRNLRKDDKDPAFNLPHVTDEVGVLLTPLTKPMTHIKNENFSLRKRRAVRSLSANIQSLVTRESLSLVSRDIDQDFEKAQSLSDLPDALQVAQKILEGNKVIGGGSIKIRNLTSGSPVQRSSDQENEIRHPESRRYCGSPGASWVERANLTDIGDRSSFFASTSTETLTDSRANLLQQESSKKRGSWQKKLRVFIPPTGENNDIDAGSDTVHQQRPPPPPTPERNSSRLVTESHIKPPPPPTPERSSSRRPSLDQSKILVSLAQLPPSADRDSPRQISRPTPPHTPGEESKLMDKRSARNSREIKIGKLSPKSDESLPVPEVVPGSPLDEQQLENLLSALAREARATSEKLEKELEDLRTEDMAKTREETTKENRISSDEIDSNISAGERAASQKEGHGIEKNNTHIKENIKDLSVQSQETIRQEEVHKYHVELQVQISEPQGKIICKTNEIKVESDDISDVQKSDQGDHEPSNGIQLSENQDKGANTGGVKNMESSISTSTCPNANSEGKTSNCQSMESVLAENKIPSQNSVYSLPVLVVEEEKSSESEVRSQDTSFCNMKESISSSNSIVSLDVGNDLVIGEDIPFIDSSDRKSLSKSPVNDGASKNCSTKDPPNTCGTKLGVVDDKSDCKCETSNISVKNAVEETPSPVAHDSCEESVQCDVQCSSLDRSSEQMSDDFCSCKEEGEEASGSAPAAGWYCHPTDPASVLVACSYCIACAHHFIGLDFLTVIGIILAIISLVAAFIL